MTFEPTITTLVGENASGKSTVVTAFARVVEQGNSSSDVIVGEDYPYGVRGSLRIEASITLTESVLNDLFIHYLARTGQSTDRDPDVVEWLQGRGRTITLIIDRPGEPTRPTIQWRDLWFQDNKLMLRPPGNQTSGVRWSNEASAVVRNPQNYENVTFELGTDVPSNFGNQISRRFKVFTEFRLPIAKGSSSGALESFGGSDTASVLFNLKNHTELDQRLRYKEVQKRFTEFFPRFEIEAVSQQPGEIPPDIQFRERGRQSPLSVDHISSGVHQVLTVITNVVAREGLIMVIEHPETLLHPHAMRALQSLIVESSKVNQIIITTHDPHFVDSNSPQSWRRVWWTPESGTHARGVELQNEDKETGQMKTALRQLSTREVVFARAVVLVEDETQEGFLKSIAPTLGRDIDAHSVSVIPVGGENGYRPYFALLDGLGV